MRRMQLYLDDQLWNLLHSKARSQRTTVSDLVREAVRERDLGNYQLRKKAMREFIGSRKVREGQGEAVEEIREPAPR